MSSKSKTREKLMVSMRKTKAEAGIESENDAEQNAGSKKAAPPAKAATKRAKTSSTVQPAKNTIDNYQSGRRVWPD